MHEPFRHQGTVSTQQQNPDDSVKKNHEIYMTRDEMFFQTRNWNYDTPPDSTTSGDSTSALIAPLTISKMPIEQFPKMAKGPDRRAGNYSKVAHNYKIVDVLAQSPATMSML